MSFYIFSLKLCIFYLSTLASVESLAPPILGVHVYTFDAQNSTQSLNQRWDVPHLLSAISGIVNRDGPRFFYFISESDEFWWSYMRSPGRWLSNATVTVLPDLQTVLNVFAKLEHIDGIAVYDAAVPQTALTASNAASFENLIPISNAGYGSTLLHYATGAGLKVSLNFTGMFTGAISGSSKCDAVLWAIDRWLPPSSRTHQVTLGYFVDYYAHVAYPAADPLFVAKATIPNHDYVISRRGFLFDLSPFADEAPNDDPGQPLGTDFDTLLTLFRAASPEAAAAVAAEFTHLVGFVPWAYKYVAPHGSHQGVAAENRFVHTTTQFNIVLDADACCVGGFGNAALWQHYASGPSGSTPYSLPTQRMSYSVEDLHTEGLLLRNGSVKPAMYVSFYVGDYDAAAWVYNKWFSAWNDSARGSVPLGWTLNPLLRRRFPPAFDIALSQLAPGDRLTSGDSGVGYINPSAVLPPMRGLSGYASGAPTWTTWNRNLFAELSYNFTGFIINANYYHASIAEVLSMYANFSAGTMIDSYNSLPFQQKFSGSHAGTYFSNRPITVMPHNSDLASPTAEENGQLIAKITMARSSLVGFFNFRSILQSASWHVTVASVAKALDRRIVFLEPLLQSALYTQLCATTGCPASEDASLPLRPVRHRWRHRYDGV